MRETPSGKVIESEEEGILKTKTSYQPIGVGLVGRYEADEDERAKMGFDAEAEQEKKQEEKRQKEIAKRNEEIMEANRKTYVLRENNKKLQDELMKTSQMVKQKLESANQDDLALRVRPFFSKDPFTKRLEDQYGLKDNGEKLEIKKIKNVNRKIINKNKEQHSVLVKSNVSHKEKSNRKASVTVDDYLISSDVAFERRSVELVNEGEFVRLSPGLDKQQNPSKSMSMISVHESEAGKVFVSLSGNQEVVQSKQNLDDTPKSTTTKKRRANEESIKDLKAHAELGKNRIGSGKNL